MLVVPVATTENVALTPSQTTASEGWVVIVMVGIVTVKTLELVAVFPPTVTVIVPVVVPIGTEVVMLVAVLAVTTAVVPLNITMLLAGVVLKFVPVIITVDPMGPE
jgi:hypothetical protein